MIRVSEKGELVGVGCGEKDKWHEGEGKLFFKKVINSEGKRIRKDLV